MLRLSPTLHLDRDLNVCGLRLNRTLDIDNRQQINCIAWNATQWQIYLLDQKSNASKIDAEAQKENAINFSPISIEN